MHATSRVHLFPRAILMRGTRWISLTLCAVESTREKQSTLGDFPLVPEGKIRGSCACRTAQGLVSSTALFSPAGRVQTDPRARTHTSANRHRRIRQRDSLGATKIRGAVEIQAAPDTLANLRRASAAGCSAAADLAAPSPRALAKLCCIFSRTRFEVRETL